MTHGTFEFLRQQSIPSLGLSVEAYRHRVTGARHYHLRADDRNNAFMVAFLTVPQDSTGVAHVLEHTSLCGSRRFPVRDPFFMMTRRSLNTFMNAFTSSDWTAYPFASQSRKDFDNLLQVYLDAVFHPRLDPLDFAQEGHRVEFERSGDPGSPLVFKGVVFNEMKGAMSSPVARLWQLMHEQLFPTITYHYNSGGEPEKIPDLTYEQLKSFHARHYHPSNAVFMTYGDISAAEHQERLEEQALGRFDYLNVADLAVCDERRYPEPVTAEGRFPVEPGDDPADKTHVALGWLLGPTTDLRATLEAQLMSGILLDNSASPLRQALETTALGTAPSELCGLDDSTREASFLCGLEGTNPESADEVQDLVLDVLAQVAKNGVPREMVESVLHQLELSQREISGGHFPYGLRLMVNALGPALHGSDPVAALDIDPVLRDLREAVVDPGYVPALVRRLLLENPHRVRVTMTPDPDYYAEQEQRERRRLAELEARMSDDDRAQVARQAEALLARQQSHDDPSVLPKVGLADVPADLPIAEGRAEPVNGLPATWYAQGTNGLVYAQLVIELPELDGATRDLLPVFCDCMTEVGYGEKDYLAAQAEQAAVTGGMGAGYSLRGEVEGYERARGFFTLSSKALVRNAEPMAGLLRSVFEGARFDELVRLRELVAQVRVHRESSVTDHGHVLAMAAACAGMAPSAAMAHRWSGLLGLKQLKTLDEALSDDGKLAELGDTLGRIRDALRSAPRQLLVVCEPDEREGIATIFHRVWAGTTASSATAPYKPELRPHRVVEGWSVTTQVNFCAKAYPTVPIGHPDAAPLMVLGRFLTNGFLHRAVREQGGAYGGGAGYDSDSGAFRFYSYRDPRLLETLADFDAAIRWMAESPHEDRELEEAILGVVSGIDRPDSPAGEAIQAFFGGLHGRTPEQRRRFRQQVLAVSRDDLLRVCAHWLRPERASTAVVSDAATLGRVANELGLSVQTL